jgi:hypothetical protein
VAARIRLELIELDSLPGSLSAHLVELASYPQLQRTLIEAIAFELHSAYVGIESVLETIARRLDLELPRTERWHERLIGQMAAEFPGVRPPVLTPDVVPRLDELRKFRHVVRVVYATKLDAARVTALASQYPGLYRDVRRCFVDFADLLDTAPRD